MAWLIFRHDMVMLSCPEIEQPAGKFTTECQPHANKATAEANIKSSTVGTTAVPLPLANSILF
jgi:hypothetical protein